jgi:tRNA pseudouridine55 synthase
VRQLVSDLGDAYCAELERTAIGPFELAAADPERIVDSNTALSFLPERVLTADEAAVVAHGVRVPLGAADDAPALRLTHAGGLVAIAEPRGQELAPVVVFAQ